MANKIRGNKDGKSGGNDTYTIPGRGSNIPRKTVVKEVEQGQHPNHSVIKVDGQKYVRSKPDTQKQNNVDPDE